MSGVLDEVNTFLTKRLRRPMQSPPKNFTLTTESALQYKAFNLAERLGFYFPYRVFFWSSAFMMN